MSKRAPPPPSAAPTISRDAVEAAKKKMAAPSGGPPPGLAAAMAKIKSGVGSGSGGGGGGGAHADDDEDDDDDDELFDADDYGRHYEETASRSKPAADDRPPQRYNDEEDAHGSRRHRYDDDDNDDYEYEEEYDDRNDRGGRGDRHDSRDRGRRGRDHDDDYDDDDDEEDERDRRRRGGDRDSRHRDGGGGGGGGDDDDYADEAGALDDDQDGDRRRGDGGGGWSTAQPKGAAPAAVKGADAKDSWAKADARPGAKSADAAPSSSAHTKNSSANTTVATATRAVPGKPAPPLVAGGKPHSFNFQPVLKATYRELRTFVMAPCEKGVVTRCYIERSRRGERMFAPVYSLCADLEDGTGRELLVCRKVMKSFTSHYVFSLKSEDLYRPRDQRSRLFLGKLRATNSNEYVLYDNGMTKDHSKPGGDDDDDDGGDDSDVDMDDVPGAKKGGMHRSKDSKQDDRHMALFRKELAVIFYNTKKRPAPLSVRGTEVCIPALGAAGMSDRDRAEAKSAGIAEGAPNLSVPFQKIRSQAKQNELLSNKCFITHERTSRYDPLSSCLVDFKVRACLVHPI